MNLESRLTHIVTQYDIKQSIPREQKAMTRIAHNPSSIIGQPVSAVADYDWCDCYPVVSNGLVVGVVSAIQATDNQDVLAGVGGKTFDEQNQWFTR